MASLSSMGLRGFSALSVLSAAKRQYPHLAEQITKAQITGYSASQILHVIGRLLGSEKNAYNPEDYMTENEKMYKRDSDRKKKIALKAIGVLGTAGAVAAGAGYLYMRNRGPQVTLLPAQQQPKGLGYTPLLGLPHNQTPQTAQGPMQGPTGPNQWVQGVEPTQQQQPTQAPSNLIVQQAMPQPQQMQQPAQRTPEQIMKSVALINNLKLQQPFNTIARSNLTNEMAAVALRGSTGASKSKGGGMGISNSILQLLDKTEGGIEQLVEDYKNYLQESEANQQAQQAHQIMKQHQQIQPQQMPQEQPVEHIQPQQPMEQQLPIEQPVEPNTPAITNNTPVNTPAKPSSITPNTVVTPHGIGEVVHKGKAGSIVDVNGKKKSYKPEDVIKPFDDVEEAVRHVIKSIPESLKSTAIQSTIFLPTGNKKGIMVTKFYDGKVAWYKDVSRDLYRSIALGQYEPKTKGKTGIGQYEPGVIDSRGAGFSSEISRNKKYAKETEGEMWGYGESLYDLFDEVQGLINKISREKYDEEGNLIQPKRKKK